ncbi:DUF6308 family protein [Arsenicicoccus bolidensis]|uniref:DUF6308 family protein n=1 Tax=Arsenicicoccus bolidensis TaxID=229480 RepID=A0ABS9PYZ2_9MICO|nr:DUF6308 family protein [Arsenicicoccus bolidensis]MCG7320845.1 DUF6308 family protein [Arsenicicoccus bolidensis]
MTVLRAYFTPLSGRNTGFTGGAWDTFDPSGRRSATADVFTADDLLSCALLSAPIRGRAAMDLLVLRADDFGALLDKVGPDREFVEIDDPDGPEFQPVRDLYSALVALPGVGETRATKLMARKRPHLVAIIDSVVKASVFGGMPRQWGPLHGVLTADGGQIHDRLLRLRSRAGLPEAVTALRVFDVLAWMDGSGNAERVLANQPILDSEDKAED